MLHIHLSRTLPRHIVLLLVLALFPTVVLAAVQPALQEYDARRKTFSAQIPAVINSAQQAADTMLARPDAMLHIPYWEQMSFSEELYNRAGGLAHACPPGGNGRTETPYDVVLLTVRSWEKQSDLIRKRVREYKAKNWTVTVIGSAAGKPRDLGADYFIDNGAPSGSAEHGRINVLANVTLGWMWCCEYAAAMSRKGRFPAILYSIAMPGATEYDRSIQTPEGRRSTVPCPKAIPAGALSKAYLQRIGKLVSDLKSRRTQQQLATAADVIAKRMAAGGTVGIAGMGHVINEEVRVDNKTPWKGFLVVGMVDVAFTAHLQPGDLLIWMAYAGMNSLYDDYGKYIAQAKVDLITCYAPDPVWAKDPPPTLAHLDQGWKLPDAEVPIPVFPHAMAPVSGINVTILLRMLDDEVAARLTKLPVRIAPVAERLAPHIYDRYGERYHRSEPSYMAPPPTRRWGFIDTAGNEVAPVGIDDIQPMSEGLAAVCRNGKWGYVDAKGTVVVPPTYDTAAAYFKGVAAVSLNGKFGCIDATGKVVVPFQYDQIADPFWTPTPFLFTRTGERWGILDRTGQELLTPTHNVLTYFSDKMVAVKQADKYGLITLTGEVVIPPKYENIGRLRRGYALVQLNGKWGAITSDGTELLPPSYAGIADITTDNLALVKIGDKWGGVDKNGTEVVPPKYDEVIRFLEGLAMVKAGKKWGAIDAAGQLIVSPQYDEVGYISDGLFPVAREGKWGCMDKTGALVIPMVYEAAPSFSGGLAMVKRDGVWQLIDKTGAMVLQPDYEYFARAGEGLYKVVRDGRWGFIDSTGKEIVPPRYSYVLSFSQGRALVAVGGQWSETAGKYPLLAGAKWGLIDKTGAVIVPPVHDRLLPYGKDLIAVGVTTEIMPPQP